MICICFKNSEFFFSKSVYIFTVIFLSPKAAWLLRAVTCIDLTTLAGDDTASNVQRLCYKAKNPVRPDLLKAMGMDKKGERCFNVKEIHSLNN